MPKVSVICPVLNSVKYINEMMDSIVNQTLSDIEIIVIDAGSTDGTFEVLREYADKDKRINLIVSDRRSVGRQCNIGLEIASGEYIGCVEADDFIAEHMFEDLYKTASSTHADIIKGNFDMFFDHDNGERVSITYCPIPNAQRVLYGQAFKPLDYIDLLFRDYNMWNGIYRREFIENNQIRLNETAGAAFQDIGFVLQTFMMAEEIIYIDGSYYRYRRDNESSSVFNNKAVKYVMDEFEFIADFMERRPDIKPFFGAAVAKRIMDLFLGYYEITDPAMRNSVEIKTSIERFRGLYQDFYKNIEQPLLSHLDFRQSLGLELLLDSTDKFEQYISARHQVDRRALLDYRDYIGRQNKVVIFGCGERGGSTYSFLRRNHIDNVKCFCDNNTELWNKMFMGQMVISPELAVKEHSDALYLIANAAHFSEIKRQLMHFGIPARQIYKAMLILPHNAQDLL